MTGDLSPFALAFMSVSMAAVASLAGYCLWRVLKGPRRPPGDEPRS